MQIDALRGVAILSVILLHYSFWLPLDVLGLPTQLISPFIHNGYYGVIIFFVISGYLITSRVLENGVSNFSARQFYVMRFGRIFPCLILMVCVVTAMTVLKPELIGFNPHKHHLSKFLAYVFTFRANRYRMESGSAGMAWDVLWSLSVEEVFYLAFPFVVKICCAKRLWPVLLIALVLIGPVHRFTTCSLYDYASCFDLIALGCLTAGIAHRFGPVKSRRSRSNVCWIGAGLILWCYAFSHVANNLVLGPSLVGMGTSLVILASVPANKDHNGFHQAFARLGSLSYELYLFHMPLVCLTVYCARQMSVYPAGTQASSLLLFWLGLLLCLVQLISRLYCEPLNRLIRRTLIRRPDSGKFRSEFTIIASVSPVDSVAERRSPSSPADLVSGGTAHVIR